MGNDQNADNKSNTTCTSFFDMFPIIPMLYNLHMGSFLNLQMPRGAANSFRYCENDQPCCSLVQYWTNYQHYIAFWNINTWSIMMRFLLLQLFIWTWLLLVKQLI